MQPTFNGSIDNYQEGDIVLIKRVHHRGPQYPIVQKDSIVMFR